MIGKTDKSPQLHMCQISIIQFFNKEHELYQLSERINWDEIERNLNEYYCVDNGRPSIPIRKTDEFFKRNYLIFTKNYIK